MLEKPDLSDAQIQTCLNASFGINVENLEFLPIGNDSNAWAYRIETPKKKFFLKIRNSLPKLASLHVPAYLHSVGINNPVAPIRTSQSDLYASLGDFVLIMYEWIGENSAWGMTLSVEQWQDWGNIMRQIHETLVTPELQTIMSKEGFRSQWDELFCKVNQLAQTKQFDDPIQQKMAMLWKQQQVVIDRIYAQLVELGTQLQSQTHKFVICHADIHQANIMIDDQNTIRIVDWDEVIIAPKERDLMFFISEKFDLQPQFAEGYGDSAFNRVTLAYYRHEWVVQEFADYGERIFLSDYLSENEKQFAYEEFKQLFDPQDVVASALSAYQ